MIRKSIIVSALAMSASLGLLPSAHADAVCVLIISVDSQCPAGCNETLKISGFGYGVPHVIRICS